MSRFSLCAIGIAGLGIAGMASCVSNPPPSAVYLIALASRLVTTCSTRAGSASSQIGSGGSDTDNRWS